MFLSSCPSLYKNVQKQQKQQKDPEIQTSTIMSRIEYKLSCQITNEQDQELLHIEMRNKSYPEECYFKHLSFDQLSPALQTLFNNLSHLYVYIIKPSCVYFDDEEPALKICVPIAEDIKEYPIPLQAKGKEEGLKRRISFLQQQKARVQDEFQRVVELKTRALQEIENKIKIENEEIDVLSREQSELSKVVKDLQKDVGNLQAQCDLKMQIIRKIQKQTKQLTPNLVNQSQDTGKMQYSQLQGQHKSEIDVEIIDNDLTMSDKASVQKSSSEVLLAKNEKHGQKSRSWAINFTLQQANEFQSRKQFWIKEVQELRKPKTLPLKRLINHDTRFEEEKVITINGIQLKKMLFVEVFINLQILDLSVNHIKNMQGLTSLRQLKKLDLSENMIQEIKGLTNSIKLVEINLACNKIKALQGLFNLVNLAILNLYRNQIKEIPKKIYKLISLQELHIDHNSLLRVSQNIELLKRLRQFTIVGNKCYSDKNRSKQIIDKLMNRGVKTVSNQFREFDNKK